jgi:hypothetical protein
LALCGIAMIPAVSDAAQTGRAAMIRVSVTPGSGSARTRFAVSFRTAQATGREFHNVYRITADVRARKGCQGSAAAPVPPTKAGATVHVVLAPSGSARWCAGTYSGRVWDVIVESCPAGKACSLLVPAPQLVGKFSFRVTRG